MKNVKMMGLLVCGLTLFGSGSTMAKTRLSVLSFEDKARGHDCYYRYYENVGRGMADQLITKLSEMGSFEILERENIKKMYADEHELINQDESTAPQKKKFKAAQYTLSGAITSFEYCASGLGAGVNVGRIIGMGDMRVGGKAANAKVVLDLRIIDVTTGEVLKSVKAEGKASRTNAQVEGAVKGVDFGSDAFYKTPIGEAARYAINDAAEKVTKAIPGTEIAKASKETEAEVEASDVFCETSNRCDFVKVFKKKEKNGKVEVFNLSSNEKKTVAKDQIMPVSKVENAKKLEEGDDIFIHLSGETKLTKCTVIQKAKKKEEVVAQCRDKKPTAYSVSGAYVAKGG